MAEETDPASPSSPPPMPAPAPEPAPAAPSPSNSWATPPPQPNLSGPPTADEKNLGMLCHLLGLIGFIIGPLIIWLMKKDQSAFVDACGKESLNFQITLLIAAVCCSVLALVVIGIFLLPIVFIGGLVFTIIAAVKASNGEVYRYPVCLRLIK